MAYLEFGVCYTPPAYGWFYQGTPAGYSHMGIIFDWGGASASNQNATHPNGVC